MLNAALFDLGGTVLVEQSYNLAKGFDEISKYLNPDSNLKTLKLAIQASQRGLSEFGILDWIKSNLHERSAEYIEVLLWDACVTLKPRADVCSVLEKLDSSGVRLAAISNAIFSSNCISRELDKHDLLQYFEFVISSADIGVRKPHPEIFISALNRMNIDAANAVYIGDSMHADVIGAESIGMTPVFFNTHAIDTNYPTISKWSEFEALWGDLN